MHNLARTLLIRWIRKQEIKIYNISLTLITSHEYLGYETYFKNECREFITNATTTAQEMWLGHRIGGNIPAAGLSNLTINKIIRF